MEPWVWALIVPAALAFIGAFWALVRRGSERNEKRLDDHIREDVAAHERLRAVETKVDNLEREVSSLRERWHELRNEVSQTLASWYNSVIQMIKK